MLEKIIGFCMTTFEYKEIVEIEVMILNKLHHDCNNREMSFLY